jgi:hypothetical protein
MRGDGDDPGHGPRIPIPGAAGAAVYAALKSLVMRCGEGDVLITKRRVAGGGYTYWITNDLTTTAREI